MLDKKWFDWFMCLVVGTAVSVYVTQRKSKPVVHITALLGSLVAFYNIGYFLGILGNFFDLVDRIKSGEWMVG